jgi:glyoxylase-like metal-dependent hydrolase (beta-lactamase superfamily II)
MNRAVKTVLKVVGVVLAVVALAGGVIFYSAFGGLAAIVDGAAPAPDVRIVKDGFVCVGVVDAGDGKVLLVDAGNDPMGKTIFAELSRRHLGSDAVSAIFLTHGHPDHTAGCRVFPGAPVYAMQADLPLVGDAATVTHPLQDGQIVEIGDLRVEVFAVPGHTPGSAVYLTRGVLFFGDSAGAARDGTMTPAVRLFTKDPRENLASLKALQERLQPHAAEVKTLAFAHTGPLDGFQPFAAFARSH